MFDSSPSAGALPLPLAQSPPYADAQRALGNDLRNIPLGELGHAQITLRRTVVGSVGYAPLAPFPTENLSGADRRTLCARFHDGVRALRPLAMIVNAPTPQIACTLGDFGYLPVVTGQVLARLVLEGPPDARRARQHQKWRNRLVRAESVGMTVTHRPFDPARHRDVLLQEARQRQCRGYRALPLAFLETLTTLAPDHARLFQARYRGKAIASMLFFRHGIGSSYLIGHNSDLGRRLSAHNLLLWRGSNWLADQGHRWLDLGPVETETPAGASLARFKLGSGATPHPLGATCVYTALTAPLGRLARHVMPNTAAHVVAGQTDPSCR